MLKSELFVGERTTALSPSVLGSWREAFERRLDSLDRSKILSILLLFAVDSDRDLLSSNL